MHGSCCAGCRNLCFVILLLSDNLMRAHMLHKESDTVQHDVKWLYEAVCLPPGLRVGCAILDLIAGMQRCNECKRQLSLYAALRLLPGVCSANVAHHQVVLGGGG